MQDQGPGFNSPFDILPKCFFFLCIKQLDYSKIDNSMISFSAVLPLVYEEFLGHIITLLKREKKGNAPDGIRTCDLLGEINHSHLLSVFLFSVKLDPCGPNKTYIF